MDRERHCWTSRETYNRTCILGGKISISAWSWLIWLKFPNGLEKERKKGLKRNLFHECFPPSPFLPGFPLRRRAFEIPWIFPFGSPQNSCWYFPPRLFSAKPVRFASIKTASALNFPHPFFFLQANLIISPPPPSLFGRKNRIQVKRNLSHTLPNQEISDLHSAFFLCTLIWCL